MKIDNFDALEQNVGAEEEVKKEIKKSERKQRTEEMRQVFQKAYEEDKTIIERAGAASEGMAVIKTLGYGDDGGIIRGEDKGDLISVSKIVGYLLKNVGSAPVEYRTEEFKEVDGQWVGEAVVKVAKPGDEFALSKKNMTILAARPEYAMQFSNGTVKKTSKQNKTNSVEGELTAYAFRFTDENLKVNDDAIKTNISKKTKGADGKDFWKIDAKFEAAFGFLYNEKEKGGKRRESKAQVDKRLLEAVYLTQLIENAGL